MVDKKMEGDEQQRRDRARLAREAGSTPSAEMVTTGASKQPHRTDQKDSHQERLASTTRGKQQSRGPQAAGPRMPNLSEEWSRRNGGRPSVARRQGKNISLSEAQSQVYQSVADLEARGEPVYLSRIADTLGQPEMHTRRILGDLLEANLIQEVPASTQPDLGSQYLLAAKT